MARKKKGKNTYKKYSVKATVAFILILVAIAVAYYFISKHIKDRSNTDSTAIISVPDASYSVNNAEITVVNGLYNNGIEISATNVAQNGYSYGELFVHFVDIGQGDGIIVQFPNGQNMLIDAGPKSKVTQLTDYIDSLGITTFDYLIATHQDEDHIGGMPTVFDKYQVNYVFRPFVYSSYSSGDLSSEDLPENFNDGNRAKTYTCTTKIYYEFLQSIVDERCGWSFFNKDSDFTMDFTVENVDYSLSFDFLTPTSDIKNVSYTDANDYSPIIILYYADYRIMFTGDAEKTTEKEFLDYYTDDISKFDVDLLKVGHHGSKTSSSQALIDIVRPEDSVISCGKGNKYKHPLTETLQRLADIGSNIYRTDVQGTIILSVGKDGSHTITTTKTDYNETDLYIGGDGGKIE